MAKISFNHLESIQDTQLELFPDEPAKRKHPRPPTGYHPEAHSPRKTIINRRYQSKTYHSDNWHPVVVDYIGGGGSALDVALIEKLESGVWR